MEPRKTPSWIIPRGRFTFTSKLKNGGIWDELYHGSHALVVFRDGSDLISIFLDLSWLIAFGVDRFLGDDVTV